MPDVHERYPKYHRRIVLLGAHIARTYPTVEAEEAHAERDHLLELVAQGWEDMRYGNVTKGQESAVRADVVVVTPAQKDHETETRSHAVRIRGERVAWDYAQTRMTEAARDALEA